MLPRSSTSGGGVVPPRVLIQKDTTSPEPVPLDCVGVAETSRRRHRAVRSMLAGAAPLSPEKEEGGCVQSMRTPRWAQLGFVATLVLLSGCLEQREDLAESERKTLEENIANGIGLGEPRAGSWPSAGGSFQVNIEATLTCSGLVRKSQTVLARAWVSASDNLSPIPVIRPRTLDLQVSMLNGLFAGAVYANSKGRPDHVSELVRALDGNAASDPCGCIVAAAVATGFPNLQSRLVAKRVICPDGMTYDPPEVSN